MLTVRMEYLNNSDQFSPTIIPRCTWIISWNEFSENSQIEPSVNYKSRSLEVLSSINHLPFQMITDLDSSDPYGTIS